MKLWSWSRQKRGWLCSEGLWKRTPLSASCSHRRSPQRRRTLSLPPPPRPSAWPAVRKSKVSSCTLTSQEVQMFVLPESLHRRSGRFSLQTPPAPPAGPAGRAGPAGDQVTPLFITCYYTITQVSWWPGLMLLNVINNNNNNNKTNNNKQWLLVCGFQDGKRGSEWMLTLTASSDRAVTSSSFCWLFFQAVKAAECWCVQSASDTSL